MMPVARFLAIASLLVCYAANAASVLIFSSPNSPNLYQSGYNIIDMAASAVEFNFPSRTVPTGPQTQVIVKNWGSTVQRYGFNTTDTNNSSYSPTAFTGTLNSGKELAVNGSSARSLMFSPNVSGQGGRLATWVQNNGPGQTGGLQVRDITPLPVAPLSFQVLDYSQTIIGSDAVVCGISRDKATVYGTRSTNVLYQNTHDGESGFWTAAHTFSGGSVLTGVVALDNGEFLAFFNLVGGTVFESSGGVAGAWTQVATSASGGYFRVEWDSFGKSGPIQVLSEYGSYSTVAANGSPDPTKTTHILARQAYGASFIQIFDAQVQFPTHSSLSTYGAAYDPDDNRVYITMGNSGPFGAGLTALLYSDDWQTAFTGGTPTASQLPLPAPWAGNTGTWWQSPALGITAKSVKFGSEGDNGIYAFPKIGYRQLGAGFVQNVISGHNGSNVFPGGFNQNARGDRFFYGVGNANAGPDVGAQIYADQLDDGQTMQVVWLDDSYKGTSAGVYQVYGPTANGVILAAMGAPGGTGSAALKMLRAKLITSSVGTFDQYANLTGDGATTVFTFPHYLSSPPTTLDFYGQNAASIAITPKISVDSTNITLTFAAAPTNAVAYSYKLLYSAVSDAATTAWVNAVIAAGGTVSANQKLRVNTLILALKAHGLFNAAIQRLWLAAGESVAQQAAIDIVNLASFTVNGTETLAAGGYTGNGSTGFINSGYIPSTAGVVTANSLHIGAYNRTSRATGGSKVSVGAFDGSGRFTYIQDAAGTIPFENNGGSFPSFVAANVQGHWISNRVGSTQAQLLKNGSSVSVNSDNSTGLTSKVIYLGAFNSNGTTANFSTDQFGAWHIGTGLTTQQASDLATDLNAYMTAWGVNVY